MKQDNDYISLTDIARFKDRERTEYSPKLDEKSRHHRVLGIWEHLNNPNFKHIEFDVFKSNAGQIVFLSHLSVGLNPLMLSDSSIKPDVMVVELLPTKILPLSLLLGYLPSLSFYY